MIQVTAILQMFFQNRFGSQWLYLIHINAKVSVLEITYKTFALSTHSNQPMNI